MRPPLTLALLTLPLAGCGVSYGVNAHRTTALREYVDSYNAANKALLATPHPPLGTMTGREAIVWVYPNMFGLGTASFSGTSEARFQNGGTHRLTVEASEKLILAAYPLRGGTAAAFGNGLAVMGHLDVNWRSTRVTVRQENGGAQAGTVQQESFAGDAMGLRPGLTVQVPLFARGSVAVSGRVQAGYDFPVLLNEELFVEGFPLNDVYFARTYAGSSSTASDAQALKAGLPGFNASAALVVRLNCDRCF